MLLAALLALSVQPPSTNQPVKPTCTATHMEDFGGAWTPAPLPPNTTTWHDLEAARGYSCPSFHHFCSRRSDAELARASRIAEWAWTPTACDLPPLHPPSFVHRVLHSANASLVLVGDSITEQHFVGVTCQLSDFVADRAVVDHPTRTVVTLTTGARVEYVRDDLLLHSGTHHMLLRPPRDGHANFHVAWAMALHASTPDTVLVLNTGAHWGDRFSVQGVANVLDHLAVHFPGTVFFRSLYEGADGCGTYTQPTPAGAPSTQYNWAMLPLYNDVWRSAIRLYRSQGHRFYYLDVATPLRQRPDARSQPPQDCLHMCMPGPVDLFTQALAAALARSEGE